MRDPGALPLVRVHYTAFTPPVLRGEVGSGRGNNPAVAAIRTHRLPAASRCASAPARRFTPSGVPQAGFTLIELLVVLAIIALLVGLALPALGGARESGRMAACASNLRQASTACWQYALDNKGMGPAIGEPYARLPNWGLVVQSYGGQAGETPGELFRNRSVLVCPSIAARYRAEPMNRTYAMNATGHSGPAMGDRSNYDDPLRPAHIRMEFVGHPSVVPLLLDSDVPPPTTTNPPPPTRTASMLDFRQELHTRTRLGRFHTRQGLFQVAMFDTSVRPHQRVDDHWLEPLP
jgi:prepilin-type N-terminal cleavage/methylation domain-containing protein